MKAPYIELQISDIRQETHDTKSFVLSPFTAPLPPYQPGQFLTLVFPGKVNEERRSYSISSYAAHHEPLTITVKRLDNGAFSRYLFDNCNVGSPLYTIGPSGFFVIPEKMDGISQLLFFAAGSGITPILPMMKKVLFEHAHVNIYLIYSNRNRENTIFYDQLTLLQAKFPGRLIIEFLFSTSKDLMKARLSKLLLVEYLQRWIKDDFAKALFYMCGPHEYMQMVTITLLREGAPAENIRREIFDVIKPVVRELPPDQDQHRVIAKYAGEEHSFDAQFPLSILASAKRAGIVLPYSCEAGKCGTCAVTCVKGHVWMSHNEVLLDRELEQGRVLTCTGFPVGGDIVIEFPSN
jgi:ferredoxin-NADP reductase